MPDAVYQEAAAELDEPGDRGADLWTTTVMWRERPKERSRHHLR
ncbi:MAG TPA: hypothetical protein VF755_06000 [Catenuloplanes sp.]